MSIENNQKIRAPEPGFRNGERLPDTERSVDRVFIHRPMSHLSMDDIRKHTREGTEVPMVSYCVGTIRGGRT